MKLGISRLTVIAVLLASVPATFGAAAERKEGQATLLETNSYPCSNCFFGTSDYYFCFAVDSKIIIAHDKIPTFNWRDPNRNYFGKVVSPWKGPDPAGQTMTIQYDDQHVWMPRADGKKVRMRQTYTHDIFIANEQCRGAVQK